MILITKTLVIFPLLAQQEQPSQGHATSAALVIRPIRSHINQYIADIHTRSFGGSAIEFWHQKEQSNIYSVLTLIAQDLVSAPSSQAFVERLFSVCGMLTVGRRNRTDKSLNMRAWLKVNHDSLCWHGHVNTLNHVSTVICTAMDVHCRYVACYNYNVYRADRQRFSRSLNNF